MLSSIGSGAGGASLAQSIADTGKSILILERGDYLPRGPDNWEFDLCVREPRLSDQGALVRQERMRRFIPTRTIGSAAIPPSTARRCFACDPGDFEERTHAGVGRVAGLANQYDDLAPYYLGRAPVARPRQARGVDPTEPGNEPDYFYPALRHDPTIAELEKHFQEQGWRPAPLPIGVMRDDDKPPILALHSLRHMRRLSVFWSARSRTRVRSPSIRC